MDSRTLPREVDVAVLGGGPAGAAAARLLASWGHTVLLVDRGSTRPVLGESLPPSCDRLFQAIGISEMIDNAGFVRAAGNTVWWGDQPRRVEHFPGSRTGHQVLRSTFDALLRRAAVESGAIVRQPAAALSVASSGAAHRVQVEQDGGRHEVEATWVLDATGRAGILAREAGRRLDAGIRTLALAGVWEREGGWSLPDESHTLVESAAHGWGWSVPVSPVRRFFTVMLDPQHADLTGGGSPDDRYHASLRRLPALDGLVTGARQVGVSWACDASPYASDPLVGDRALLMGDAASFIDPLSSFGVKKALASAWLAAVTVHTALTTPDMHSAAIQLFARRERAYVAAATRDLAELSHGAGSGAAGFWAARASLISDEADELSVEALRVDPEVRGAFEALRARESITLRLASGTRIEPRPIVRDHRVVVEPHLVSTAFPGGVRFLRNVDVLAIARIAATEQDVGRMYDRYVREAGPAALPDFLGGLSVLLGKHVCDLA